VSPSDDLPVRLATWTDAVLDRHTREFTPSEFLKAVRALSVRYVERRRDLPVRSPLDSAGKRAAFAAFFAPLHLIVAVRVLAHLREAIPAPGRVIDLGCGTGVASAAWGLVDGPPAFLQGVDTDAWALKEATWNWRALRLTGRTARSNLVSWFADRERGDRDRTHDREAVVLGWSANELTGRDRARLLPVLLRHAAQGGSVLVLEPLARSAVPWWNEWDEAFRRAGGRADEWRLPAELPERLAALDEAAGFRREVLGARTLLLAPPPTEAGSPGRAGRESARTE
jgi:Methyltransferase small domain